jgi:1,4-dihydroxy-2-naphthoate polyprenyltransferase
MDRLARRIGLGLAARGEVDRVVGWAADARRAGLDSAWIHDSYFERDAITYATAIARDLAVSGPSGFGSTAIAGPPGDGFRIALGAVNPYTRHPLVLAMTGSALDEIAPGRIVMGLGTGLPLRLRQMGIPYEADEAVERVERTIDELRALWAGERLPSATPGLPPIQPMFEPPHRIPLVVAAYRKEFVALAGRKADGYLARPAESIPSLRGILDRLRGAATAAGRDPAAVETAGYLLALVDDTRRAALNRAKREPFVIYMMSILGDVALARAGFERELRDRIAAAWRAEDYHAAAAIVPDELLDAFMLCGTREDVAAGALAFHVEAGLELPLLQPVLQDERQVRELMAAAVLYASLPTSVAARGLEQARPVTVAAGPTKASSLSMTDEAAAARGFASLEHDHRLGLAARLRRGLGTLGEVLRPFAYSASAVPVAAGGALALVDGKFDAGLFVLALCGGVFLHSGTNIVNEIYDVRQGVDTITSPRASHAILTGRITEHRAYVVAFAFFALATALGLALAYARGWPIIALGAVGLAGGYFYTAPPFQYKYRALGVPLVFLLMGPLMTVGGYFATSGAWSMASLALSIPVGLLVAAILHGNEWRDIGEDTRAGIVTLSARIGREAAHVGYIGLVLGAYMTLGLGAAVGAIPSFSLLAILSLPLLAQVVRSAELGASGQVRAITWLDIQTARLHLVFGALLIGGVALSAFVR